MENKRFSSLVIWVNMINNTYVILWLLVENNNNKLFYKDTEYFMSTRQLYDWNIKPITNAIYNKTLILLAKGQHLHYASKNVQLL